MRTFLFHCLIIALLLLATSGESHRIDNEQPLRAVTLTANSVPSNCSDHLPDVADISIALYEEEDFIIMVDEFVQFEVRMFDGSGGQVHLNESPLLDVDSGGFSFSPQTNNSTLMTYFPIEVGTFSLTLCAGSAVVSFNVTVLPGDIQQLNCNMVTDQPVLGEPFLVECNGIDRRGNLVDMRVPSERMLLFADCNVLINEDARYVVEPSGSPVVFPVIPLDGPYLYCVFELDYYDSQGTPTSRYFDLYFAVLPGPMDSFHVESNGSTTLEVLSGDSLFLEVSGEPAANLGGWHVSDWPIDVNWSLRASDGTIIERFGTGQYTFVAGKSGTISTNATYDNLTREIEIIVHPGPLHRLEVDLAPAARVVDQPVTIVVTGFDEYGNQVELNATDLVVESSGGEVQRFGNTFQMIPRSTGQGYVVSATLGEVINQTMFDVTSMDAEAPPAGDDPISSTGDGGPEIEAGDGGPGNDRQATEASGQSNSALHPLLAIGAVIALVLLQFVVIWRRKAKRARTESTPDSPSTFPPGPPPPTSRPGPMSGPGSGGIPPGHPNPAGPPMTIDPSTILPMGAPMVRDPMHPVVPPHLLPRPDVATSISNRFEIGEMIAEGGMARVFRARERRTDQVVIWKQAHQKFNPISISNQKLVDESELLQICRHNRIPRYIAHGEIKIEGETEAVLIEEFIEGGDLLNTVEQFRKMDASIPLEKVIETVSRICEPLEQMAVLQSPIYHRDLKPHNVIVHPTRGPVLIDFGLAKMVTSMEDVSITRSGSGTWTAPERDAGVSGPFTDVYSLGKILYFLCTRNKPPAILSWDDCLHVVDSGYPQWIAELILRSAHPRFQERIQSVGWFRLMLESRGDWDSVSDDRHGSADDYTTWG